MDDAEFLEGAVELLPTLLPDDVHLIEARVDRRRDWLRAEARFQIFGGAGDGRTPWDVCGSAFAALDQEWRYLSGYDLLTDYAQLLADKIRSAVQELLYPVPRPGPPTGPGEVEVRWQWLLQRLSEIARPVEQGDGSIRVAGDDGDEFTVLVTPEQWARIAEPLDPYSDDPQDFNPQGNEPFLVFYEESMVWSVRAELPPVPFGAEIKRSFREARERGEDMTRYGWFAYTPLGGDGARWDGGSE